MKSKYEMDMTEGPLLGKILIFAMPLLLSGLLQLLYNAADIIVLGQFRGQDALAAVGSTGALTNLIVNLFIGLSVGTSVVVGRYLGAKRPEDVRKTIQTSVLLALISSGICMAVAIPFAPTFLEWMGSPDGVIEMSSLYMRIYFLGAPASLMYNFCAGILRAAGDTRRPLIILGLSGLLNVGLNLFFVLGLGMSVAGVALATIASQYLSCALALRCLLKKDGAGDCRLELKGMRIYTDKLKQVLIIGIPSGLHSILFALSNTVIQSTVNSFGPGAIAGNAAAANIEGFLWTAMDAVAQTGTAFVSQNIGARKISRLNRIYLECWGVVAVIGLALSAVVCLFPETFIGLYNREPEVLFYGVSRLMLTIPFEFINGSMNMHNGILRGMGRPTSTMIIGLVGVCGLRMVWIATVFQASPTWETLLICYPITWSITVFAQVIWFRLTLRKFKKQYPQTAVA